MPGPSRQPLTLGARGTLPGPESATVLPALREYFRGRSVPAFLVGGYLRDSLRGLDTKDVDIAVQGEALSLARDLAEALGGSSVPLSREHGVARVVVSPSADDGPPSGGWVIDLTPMKGGIEADLGRRDFAVDSMGLDLGFWGMPGWEERILDPFDGRGDVEKRVIRAIDGSVFREDPVRLLRAVRLAARLGYSIDPDTSHLIRRDAHLISATAGERVRDELLAILSSDGAKDHLETLDGLGLLCCIIPELAITKGVEQPGEHYWDVYGHSIQSVGGVERLLSRRSEDSVAALAPWNSEMEEYLAQEAGDGHARSTVLKLAALLHDIAKPQTKAVDSTGRTRFLGHHTLGASMSDEILDRIRLSNRGQRMVHGMVESHLRPIQMSQGSELPTPRAAYRYFRDVGDVAIDTLYLSLADHLAARGPELDMEGWQRHVDIVAHVLEMGTREASPEKMTRLVTGHDLIQEFGLSPGPLIGSLLEEVREAEAAGHLASREEALGLVRGRLTAQARPAGEGGQ